MFKCMLFDDFDLFCLYCLGIEQFCFICMCMLVSIYVVLMNIVFIQLIIDLYVCYCYDEL